MFAPKYTVAQYREAFLSGAKKHPYYVPEGIWRPIWLSKLRLTPYYYTVEDLWMSYFEGFNGHPMPKEKKR